MRRFREYYRQFEEMPPEEVSLELRARREEEKRRALSRIGALDLSGSEWHEPPHPEAVNAATFALRRALNAYPERSAGALREAVGARFGVAAEQVVLGHGAGELLRAACAAAGAGGRRDARRRGRAGSRCPGSSRPPAAAPCRCRRRPPGSWSGRARPPARCCSPRPATRPAPCSGAARCGEVCAGVPEGAIVVVDEALGEFAPDGEDAAALVAELPNLLVVRSFSKAHAMAGLRAGAALGPAELVAPLAPSGGMSAPAQAAAGWAVSERGAEIAARRRATAASLHARLAAALAGSPVAAAPSGLPFAWLSSSDEDGPALAARLAAAQVFVAPGRLWGDERHVRAALRGPAAVDRLAAALVG